MLDFYIFALFGLFSAGVVIAEENDRNSQAIANLTWGTTTEEPKLGLHDLTEQQLKLNFYNFICSSHFNLDCKITETLQICVKDNYVAVLGLPLSFEKDSKDLNVISKWIRKCDKNEQDLNQYVMRIIRKQIGFQNDNEWKNVFNSGSPTANAKFTSSLIVIFAIALVFF